MATPTKPHQSHISIVCITTSVVVPIPVAGNLFHALKRCAKTTNIYFLSRPPTPSHSLTENPGIAVNKVDLHHTIDLTSHFKSLAWRGPPAKRPYFGA